MISTNPVTIDTLSTPLSHAQGILTPTSPHGIYMIALQFDVSSDKYSVCLLLDTQYIVSQEDAKRARCELFWESAVTKERVFIALPYLYSGLAYYQQHNQLLQSLGLTTVGDLSLNSQIPYEQFRSNFADYDSFHRFLFEGMYYGGVYQTLFWQSNVLNPELLSHEILQNALHRKSAPHQDLCLRLAQGMSCVYDPADLVKTNMGSLDCGIRLLKNAKAVANAKALDPAKLLHRAVYAEISHVHFSSIYPAFDMLATQETLGDLYQYKADCLPLSLQFLLKVWLNPTGEQLQAWCQTDGFLSLLYKNHHLHIDAFGDTPLAYQKFAEHIDTHESIPSACHIAIGYIHKSYTPYFIEHKGNTITDPLSVFLWRVSRSQYDIRSVAVVTDECFNSSALTLLLSTSRHLLALHYEDHWVILMDKIGSYPAHQPPRTPTDVIIHCQAPIDFYHALEPVLLSMAMGYKEPHPIPLIVPQAPYHATQGNLQALPTSVVDTPVSSVTPSTVTALDTNQGASQATDPATPDTPSASDDAVSPSENGNISSKNGTDDQAVTPSDDEPTTVADETPTQDPITDTSTMTATSDEPATVSDETDGATTTPTNSTTPADDGKPADDNPSAPDTPSEPAKPAISPNLYKSVKSPVTSVLTPLSDDVLDDSDNTDEW